MALGNIFSASKLIDATHVYSASTPAWPGTTPLLRCPTGVEPFCQESYVIAGGCGTHMDAPLHIMKGGRSISDIEAAELVSPLVLIDVQKECALDPDFTLTVADVLKWEEVHGRMPAGAMVVMKTGWSTRWHDISKYQNVSVADGKMHFPGFSAKLASFLITEREIHGIGIDTLSLDPGVSDDFPVHVINLGDGKYQLENLNLSDSRIPESGAWIIASPVRLEGAPEAPARVFIVLP